MSYVIRTQHLSKRYDLGVEQAAYGRATESLARFVRTLFDRRGPLPHERSSIWALRDVSFSVSAGEVVGVIGRNGTGKTTLLKLLSRVTEPTEGSIDLKGRVSSLLEVGTGFHPELTGRENIYLNGAILGMSRRQIESRFDEIVDFAEISGFIDTPVKRYSSGMYVRLAFAVAAHLEPDVLIVDEVLAVGDLAFQKKCISKMDDVSESGRTVLIVSHSMSTITRLCTRAVLLEGGEIRADGIPEDVVNQYLAIAPSDSGQKRYNREAQSGDFRMVSIRLLDQTQEQTDRVSASEPFSIEIAFELLEDIRELRVGLVLYGPQGDALLTSFDIDTEENYARWPARKRGIHRSACSFPPDSLNEGKFVVGLQASVFGVRRVFTDNDAISFSVDAAAAVGSRWVESRPGALRPRLAWTIE